MNWRRIAVGTVVLGLVANVMDYVLNTYVLPSMYAAMSSLANPTPSIPMFVLADFAGAFMLMLAWDKVGAAFGSGTSAGATFGLAAGLFVTFPMILVWQLQLNGMPYHVAWVLICVISLEYAALGAVAAALDGKGAAA